MNVTRKYTHNHSLALRVNYTYTKIIFIEKGFLDNLRECNEKMNMKADKTQTNIPQVH